MSTICSKCSHPLAYPPSLLSLHKQYPTLTVDATLDRSQLRCRYCDEMLASKLALEAEIPPPNYSNSIAKLEKTIQTLKKLVKEDVEEEGEQRTLESVIRGMQLRWAKLVKKRDVDIKSAWKPYWAIWGVTEGEEAFSKA